MASNKAYKLCRIFRNNALSPISEFYVLNYPYFKENEIFQFVWLTCITLQYIKRLVQIFIRTTINEITRGTWFPLDIRGNLFLSFISQIARIRRFCGFFIAFYYIFPLPLNSKKQLVRFAFPWKTLNGDLSLSFNISIPVLNSGGDSWGRLIPEAMRYPPWNIWDFGFLIF